MNERLIVKTFRAHCRVKECEPSYAQFVEWVHAQTDSRIKSLVESIESVEFYSRYIAGVEV